MHFFKSKLTQAVICATILASCNSSDENEIPAENIGLENQSTEVFFGKKTVNQLQMEYDVRLIDNDYYQAQLQLEDKSLAADVYFSDQHIDFKNDSITLSTKEKEALLILGEEISLYLFQDRNTDDFSMPEYTLLRLLEYWARSPQDYIHTNRSTQKDLLQANTAEKNSANEGITCIRKNTFLNAEYDTSSGQEISERVQVNGNDCLGRCGSGCGSWISLASAWTKDCLDHDQCGRQLGGSSNPVDINCGDEYSEAADDFLFGVIRGCSG